jgi:outer membrane protein TolC
MSNLPHLLLRVVTVGLGVCAMLVVGCVDQKKEVAHYRKILDQTFPPTTAPTPAEQMTLQRAMALANQNNEQLGLSGEDYVQALIQKNRIVANFLPTVSFQPQFILADRPESGINNGAVAGISTGFRTSGSYIYQTQMPVVGNINVFRGFGDVSNLQAAEAVIAQRKDLLLDLQATITLNVAQTYYQILRSQASVAVLQSSLQLQQDRLAFVTQQFHNGLAIQLSVAQTRAQVDATRVELLQAQSDVRNGRSTLSLLIGTHETPNPLIDSFLVPENPATEPEFEQEAMQSREDLLAARAQVEAAKHQVDAAISEYYPSVSLNVTGFLYREFYADASKWNALLSANLPIFSAGIIEADVRDAWSRLRQAALNESAVRRQALNDVQIAYENLANAQLRIREERDQVAAAQDAYQQAQQSFRNGLAINLDVITAQNDLLNAQLQLTSDLFDRTIFYLDLIRATGQLPEIAAAALPATQPTAR